MPGVSSSEAAQAGAQLEELLGRRWEQAEILVIYLDGMQLLGLVEREDLSDVLASLLACLV